MENTANKAIDYGFILLLVGLLAAFFAGVSIEAGTFFTGIRNLAYAFTNRDQSGNAISYPANAPNVPTGAASGAVTTTL